MALGDFWAFRWRKVYQIHAELVGGVKGKYETIQK